MDSESLVNDPLPVAAAAPRSRTDRYRWALVLVLRGGVLAASGLLALGFVLLTLRGTLSPVEAPLEPPPTAGVLASAFAAGPMTLLSFGLFLLICLPVARVVLSLVHFARERDHLYVCLTAAVLFVLVVGIAWGKAL